MMEAVRNKSLLSFSTLRTYFCKADRDVKVLKESVRQRRTQNDGAASNPAILANFDGVGEFRAPGAISHNTVYGMSCKATPR